MSTLFFSKNSSWSRYTLVSAASLSIVVDLRAMFLFRLDSFKNDFLEVSIRSVRPVSLEVIACTNSSHSSLDGSGTGTDPQLMLDALLVEGDRYLGIVGKNIKQLGTNCDETGIVDKGNWLKEQGL